MNFKEIKTIIMSNSLINSSLLSSFHFDIFSADFKRVGNKNAHPEVDFAWHTSVAKFKFWGASRLWCVEKGEAQIETTFGSFTLKPRHAYFIPQGTLISAVCDDYMEQYFVDFITSYDLIPIEKLFLFNHVSSEYDLILPMIKEIIKMRHSDEQKNNASILSQYKTTAFMNAILAHFTSKIQISHEKSEPFLKVIKLINNSYKSNLSISQLADLSGYNCEYFSRTFKSTFGVSPQAYIINKRLAVAKHFLITTDLPVSTIATECGYTDPLYFTKVFTKHVGIPPTIFRTITNE